MSLSVTGVWAVGVWDQTVWADGVWREGEYTPEEQTWGEGNFATEIEWLQWRKKRRMQKRLRNGRTRTG